MTRLTLPFALSALLSLACSPVANPGDDSADADPEGSGDDGSDGGSGDGTDGGAGDGSDGGAGDGMDGTGGTDGGSGDGGDGTDVSYTVCADGSAPYTELQPAIDAAATGDEIRVCAGVYGAVAIVEGHDVALIGDGWGSTTIAGGSGTAIAVEGGALRVEDFSVRGTGVSTGGARGGAIHLNGGSLEVRSVRVDAAGGYMVVLKQNGDLTIEDSVFESNTTSSDGWLFYLVGEGDVRFVHNTVRDSTVHRLWRAAESDFEVYNNIFSGLTFGADTTAFQVEEQHGGRQDYVNNVFYDIDSADPTRAVLFYVNGPRFLNNIVAGCNAEDLPNAEYRLDSEYSLFWDNGETYGGRNCVEADPYFTDASAADFTLQLGYSPAIDGGDPAASYNDTDGTRNDMGAYGGPLGSW